MNLDILLARQPIFDRDLKVVGYELLYRSAPDFTRAVLSSDDTCRATCEVLLNTYTSVFDSGTYRLLPAFVNFGERLLLDKQLPSLPREHLVLEILEDVSPSPPVIARLKALRKAGFKLALDDFVLKPGYEPLLELAHIVKLDIRQLGPQLIEEQVRRIKPYPVVLLAEKVETMDELELCKTLGFKLFQGFFLSRPQLVSGRQLSSNRLILLELLAALNQEEVSVSALEKVINQDPQLCVKILRLLNSAQFALRREVSSISEAITLLGLEELRRWALLISLTSPQTHQSPELSRQILTRASMCERLAVESGLVRPDTAFMAGLLSGLDALFTMPLASIIEHLPLNDGLRRSILFREGDVGLLINESQACLEARWDQLSGRFDDSTLSAAEQEALNWVLEATRAIRAIRD
ncbi:HDOD domain-containing protein [Marinobacterium sp. D7]|uniref:EAL and HDOD domain-containing protein n=1 Tax=Marinobacterium ramblicola TaxID=2849041 RepID=UPI001C2D1E88|nr:HDOD domain-containing protein [Marinobacterium ramblicola]MBV1787077.1 HDOD domain-containing protein [Marinobacterium ramblicola]